MAESAWNQAIDEMTEVKTEEMIGKGDCKYSLPFYEGSPVKELAAEVNAALAEFQQGRQVDDITLVIVRRVN